MRHTENPGLTNQAAALTAQQAECASLRAERENVVSSPLASGLLLTLKAECETQHARAEAAETQLASLGRETRALRERVLAIEQLIPQWRKRGFGAPIQRHACSSCGLTDEEYAEVDGWNRAVSRCADELDAALASPSGAESTK